MENTYLFAISVGLGKHFLFSTLSSLKVKQLQETVYILFILIFTLTQHGLLTTILRSGLLILKRLLLTFCFLCKPWPYLVNFSRENSREYCKLGDSLSQLGLKSSVEQPKLTKNTVVGFTSFWRSLMYFKFVVNKAQMLPLLLEIAAFLKNMVVGECDQFYWLLEIN